MVLTNLLWTETVLRFFHLESSCSSKYELLAANKNLKTTKLFSIKEDSTLQVWTRNFPTENKIWLPVGTELSSIMQFECNIGVLALLKKSTKKFLKPFSVNIRINITLEILFAQLKYIQPVSYHAKQIILTFFLRLQKEHCKISKSFESDPLMRHICNRNKYQANEKIC